MRMPGEDPWSSLEHARAALRMCEELHHTVLHTFARGCHGMSLWYLGAMAEAEQVSSAKPRPRTTSWGPSPTMWLFSLAWMRADRGALDEARRAAQRLIHLGNRAMSPWKKSRGHWALAEVLRRERDLEGAEREIQAALGTIAMVTAGGLPGRSEARCAGSAWPRAGSRKPAALPMRRLASTAP